MKKRFNIQHTAPAAFDAVLALEAYLTTTSLPKKHLHLIKIRASQINGCAYCIDMHTKEALKDGETHQRLFVLSAWRETDLFTTEEQLLLRLTEAVTLIHQGGVSDQLYTELVGAFDELLVAQYLMAIVTINAWNRIVITSQLRL